MNLWFVILGYVVPIVWFLGAEIVGLARAGDRLPPFTQIVRGLIRRSWLFAGMLLWLLAWSVIHFYLGVT